MSKKKKNDDPGGGTNLIPFARGGPLLSLLGVLARSPRRIPQAFHCSRSKLVYIVTQELVLTSLLKLFVMRIVSFRVKKIEFSPNVRT